MFKFQKHGFFKSFLGPKSHLLWIFYKNAFASQIVGHDNILGRRAENLCKKEKLKKLDFHSYENHSVRVGYYKMKGKTKISHEF
jgi:hypothetical protein